MNHHRSFARALSLLLILTLGTACTDFKRWAYARGDRDRWQQPKRVIATLQIAPGEKVGIVGRSGAGKTTLMNVLLRLFDLRCPRSPLLGKIS